MAKIEKEKALDVVRQMVADGQVSQEVAEKYFPELKSEDERIRKGIIRNLEYLMDRAEGFVKDELKERIAWLEKVGKNTTNKVESNLLTHERAMEISPFMRSGFENEDKVEPKFHEGEWVILTAGELSTTLQIVEVDTDKKLYWFNDSSYLPIVDEECLHLWTIQDAKDGDVIYSRHNTESFEWIGIFKSLDKENKRVFFYGFWHDMTKTFIVCGNEAYVLYDDFSPATKEQRDQLKKAMADAGYTFDSEKKELKEIEPDEWSDECCINQLIVFCGNCMVQDAGAKRCAHWLKSLRPQNTWKPCDEQMDALNYVVNLMASSERPTENDLYYNILKSLRQQLKKLREK